MRLAIEDRKLVSRIEPITEREALENLFLAIIKITIADLAAADPEAIAWCLDYDADGPFSVTSLAAMFGADPTVLVRWMALRARQTRVQTKSGLPGE